MRYSVGIDIAKHVHQMVILDESGKALGKPLAISNTREGFTTCVTTLQQLEGAVEVAMEATGPYWLALYECLHRAGLRVHVFNPLQIHAYRQTGIRHTKTDRRDAFWIADFVRIGVGAALPPPDKRALQLRELARFRWNVIDQIADTKRKVLNVLDRIFPEFESLFSDIFLAGARAVLQHSANPDELAAFDVSELTALLRTHSHGRFGQAKAEAVQSAARDSVGVTWLADAAQLEVGCLLAQVEFLQAQVEQVDAALAELVQQLPQHLSSIPGLGPTTTVTLLGEIGDIQRFDTLEKLVGYSGIDARMHQSGQFTASQMHMSKRGSPYLRRALWLSANVARQHDPELHAYYERKRAEGKHHNTVLGAICRKLLARIFVVLKEQRPYELRAGSATA